MTKRKVLVSVGFGAGFATWNDHHIKSQALAEDPVLIRLVEEDKADSTEFKQRCVELAGEDCYYGGIDQLEVQEVEGRYKILEYDGSEYVITEGDLWD